MVLLPLGPGGAAGDVPVLLRPIGVDGGRAEHPRLPGRRPAIPLPPGRVHQDQGGGQQDQGRDDGQNDEGDDTGTGAGGASDAVGDGVHGGVLLVVIVTGGGVQNSAMSWAALRA